MLFATCFANSAGACAFILTAEIDNDAKIVKIANKFVSLFITLIITPQSIIRAFRRFETLTKK